MKNHIQSIWKENFRHATLNFIFIIAYVNIFQMVFGPQNSIVGVIFTIMMSASMVRDLTAHPVRHLLIQSAVLTGIAISAFLVASLPPVPAFFVNLAATFLILYAYTFEYSSHMYFPYILSYLFLVFISPVEAGQLPLRLLGMLAGAVSIILYQLFMGRKRVVVTARDALGEIMDASLHSIRFVLDGEGGLSDPAQIRSRLCELSTLVYERRRKALCVSDASFHMIDAGRGLEHLVLLVRELEAPVSGGDRLLLEKVCAQLEVFRSFLNREIREIPLPAFESFAESGGKENTEAFYHALSYIRDRLMHMADPQKRLHYPKTALSIRLRLQAALDISPVRVIYALRTALLLSAATLAVQLLALPHGKWLLFTLASVSLPYADEVPAKIKKRVAATVIGGLASVVLFTAVESGAGRTALMMLSGYISFYLTGYTATFSCSTVGALGGAVFTGMFGLGEVAGMFLIRLCYILAGALTGYIFHCLLVPCRRAGATRQLWNKYQKVVMLLSEICQRKDTDSQLYYHLVIQAHMMEKKLALNASDSGWTDMPNLLARCRDQVRKAHRTHIPDREDAILFDEGRLPAAN